MSTRSWNCAKTKRGLIVDANACAHAEEEESPHANDRRGSRAKLPPLWRNRGTHFRRYERGRKRFRGAKIKAKQRKVRESGESVARRRVAFLQYVRLRRKEGIASIPPWKDPRLYRGEKHEVNDSFHTVKLPFAVISLRNFLCYHFKIFFYFRHFGYKEIFYIEKNYISDLS